MRQKLVTGKTQLEFDSERDNDNEEWKVVTWRIVDVKRDQPLVEYDLKTPLTEEKVLDLRLRDIFPEGQK